MSELSELRKKYYKTIGFNPSEASALAKREKALNRAYELRSFEIEHYWKRATYFWAFQVAIFAAFGLLWRNTAACDWSLVTVALSGFGVLTAFANSLSARGSKFWQENWEKHIDMLEDEIEGRLHKTVWLSEQGKISFSVSRVNETLSDFFIVFWIVVTLYVAYEFVEPLPLGWLDIFKLKSVLASTLLALTCIGVAYLFHQTSRPRGVLSNGGSIECCSIGTGASAKLSPQISLSAMRRTNCRVRTTRRIVDPVLGA